MGPARDLSADDSIAPLVVVGTGFSGLMAACVAGDSVPTTIITDRGLGTSNSAVAQGGLQLPHDTAESLASFRADMIASGGPSVQPARLEAFLRAVRSTVQLLEEWGLELDLAPGGEPVRRLAGGMSEPRVVTAGDRIGAAVLKVLRGRIAELPVTVVTRTRVTDLVPRDDGITLITDEGRSIRARAAVLAIGGGAYEHAARTGSPTSNPANRNSTLYAVLRRIGLHEVDPDLFQYQPFGVVDPTGSPTGKCVPESVVELGARVIDNEERPVARPFANRRELSEAMFEALRGPRALRTPSGTAALRLTLGSVPTAELDERYPHLRPLYERCRLPDGDVLVVPVVHYQLGGFEVGPDGSTPIPGLYLAGEVTGGLHGVNRLMGNGITEAVVDGRLAGEAVVGFLEGARAL